MLSLIHIKSLVQLQGENIFYILGSFSFILGIFLSNKPVFVEPIDKKKIMRNDEHDSAARFAFFMFIFFITLPLQIRIISDLATDFIESAESNDFITYSFLIIYILMLIMFILMILILLREGLVNILRIYKKRRSLRPIYCKVCKKPLRNINNLLNNFLNDKEITAKRIKSIYFEAWHCKNCCRETEYNSFHLRKYINLSDNFKICPDCQELTMTKNSRIIKNATTTEEGKRLILYRCQCCFRREEKVEIIPIDTDSSVS